MTKRTGQGRLERERVRGWYVLTGAALCAGLTGGLVSPVWAGSLPGDRAGDVELGSFALGDALEGTINELDGSFGFTLSAGGLQLAWDSRAVADDPVRLGRGWSFGLGTIGMVGGVWVRPASGGAFEMDETAPTGLAGYPRGDVSFERAEPGAVVPARGDGSVGDTPYAFVLHELGGVSTYFDAAGYPVAKLVVGGDRVDWRWKAGEAGRLLAVVSADGSVTALDWSDPSRLVIVPGSNVTDPLEGSGVGGRWEIALDGGRVTAVADPVGGRTEVAYTPQGLVHRVATQAGASTAVDWRSSTDGVARVDRVRLVDGVTGAELSARRWEAQGPVAPSGWPFAEPASAARSAAAVDALAYETSLSDGKTRVSSVVDHHGRLAERKVVVASSSGERIVQGQEFAYPDEEAPHGPSLGRSQPIAATTTHHGRQGETRSATESYAFDELGRMVSRTTTDGATTRRAYDDEVSAERSLPIGLVTEETTTAHDGLITSTKSELSDDRAVVVATERWSGREGAELTRTSRVERDVDDGYVTEERIFPGGDPGAVPVVTRWSKQSDLVHGTKTVVQTVAAGTAIESSTSSVSSLVHGGAITETDVVGNVTTIGYDDAGRQISVADEAGYSVTRQYRTKAADGVNALTITDSRGVVATEERDVLGRVVRKTDNIAPSGRVTEGYERVSQTRTYDGPGVERVTDAWGATTTTEHDVFGRLSRRTLPNGVVQVTEHDDVAGSATSGLSVTGELADAELISTTTTDPAGQKIASTGTRADGVEVPETTTEFDGLGRAVRSTEGGRSTTTEYDVFGNAIATKVASEAGAEGAELTAERRYDAFGASVEKTLRSDSGSSAGQRRVLDELGRVTSQTDQRGVSERATYTPDGLVEELVSDTGRSMSFEYDARSRALVATRVSAPSGATVSTSYRHDDAGRLIAVFDPADEAGTRIGHEYDDFGNVTRTTYPDGTEIRHEFDAHGRKTATIDADGNRTDYAFDGAGALVQAIQVDRDGTPVSGVRYAYDQSGRVDSLERENGVRTEYTFTSAAQVSTEVTTGPDGIVSEREYAYAPAGTLTSRIDRVRDEDGQLHATRTDYEYDERDHLVRSSLRDGDTPEARVLTRSEYEPTIGGDLGSETVTTEPDTAEAVTVTRQFEYSEIGELTAIVTDGERQVQAFDAEGNLLTTATGAQYEYDAAGRPITHTTHGGVRTDTTYWADGTRREHATTTGATRFYWDGVRLLNEVHDTAEETGTASYLIGTSRHARSIRPEHGGAGTAYYGTDRHGNVTDLTDQTGAVTTEYAYTDYGVATVAGDPSAPLPGGIGELGYNPFQYAGEYTYRDGTQALGPRIYDAGQARFLSKDDAPLANLYAFADLNPITNVDPTGRMSEQDQLHIGLAIGGFVAALIGAALMISSGGALLSVLGFIGAGSAGGDLVFAGFEVVNALSDVKFMDPKVTEIASWTIFAAGLGVGLGGAAAKIATRGKKLASSAGAVHDSTSAKPAPDVDVTKTSAHNSRPSSIDENRTEVITKKATQDVIPKNLNRKGNSTSTSSSSSSGDEGASKKAVTPREDDALADLYAGLGSEDKIVGQKTYAAFSDDALEGVDVASLTAIATKADAGPLKASMEAAVTSINDAKLAMKTIRGMPAHDAATLDTTLEWVEKMSEGATKRLTAANGHLAAARSVMLTTGATGGLGSVIKAEDIIGAVLKASF